MLQTAELLKKVRKLEIVTGKLVDDVIGGAYHSVFKGRGIEFDEVREYTFEDDVRDIDWNVSARLNSPYVKKYIEERELTVLLMLDVSSSINSAVLNDKAVEAAALLGMSAIGNHDRVGLSLFSDRVEKFLSPRNGRHNNLRLIRELVAVSGNERTCSTDIAGALRETARIMKKRGVVFLLSDLIAPEEFAASLRLLKAKQDVVAIELSDPADEKFILKNPVTFEDAETGEIVEYSGNIAEINAALNAVQEEKSAVCRRAGVDLIKVDCGGDILKPLIGFFSERQKRIR